MQFLWKYIDDLVGKGLEWYVVTELLIYCSAQLVQLALPLAILLSSIMTLGNIAEKYELAAIKASGLSLQRAMLPLIITVFTLSVSAYLYANFVLPIANLKFYSLLYDITEQKPAINIKEGIFYNGINDISIRVGRKDKNGKDLYNVMIYNHLQHRGASNIIIAEKGNMLMSPDKQYLVLSLQNGATYEEVFKEGKIDRTKPYIRSTFKSQELRLQLSDFKLQRSDEGMFRDNYSMLNTKQLMQQADTIYIEERAHQKSLYDQIARNISFNADSVVKYGKDTLFNKPSDFLYNKIKMDKLRIIDNALNNARSNVSYIDFLREAEKNNSKRAARYVIEWQRKITLSFACIVLFLIGAPLGAIIKKGGLGMPVVVSVLFFVIFHIISITGEKMAKEESINPVFGMWLATIILLPIGIFLTYKATSDSALFDAEAYMKPFKKIISKFKKGQ